MVIEEGDFVEIDYTGRHEDGVFDTTSEEVADEHDLGEDDLGPITVVVGEEHLVPGLDDALVGKDVGEEYTFDISAEDAFGEKSSDLLSIVPMSEFKDQGVEPFVGLEVNIDNQRGTVRSVNGGRVIVDFNHPLAGKDVTYTVTVHRTVEDAVERVEAVLELMGVPYEDVTGEGESVTVSLANDLPEQVREEFIDQIEDVSDVDVTLDTPDDEE